MRILMLTHTYPPLLGGIERHVRTLSVELVRRGHSVAVVTLGDGQLPTRDTDAGVRVYRLRGSVHRLERLLFSHPGRSYSPPIADPEITWQLRAIISDEQPAIVHAHNWMVHAFLPLKRWSDARLVVTLHDYGMVCARWNFIRDGEPCGGPSPQACLPCGARHFGAAKGIPTVALGWLSSRWAWAEVDRFLAVSRAVAVGNQLAEHDAPHEVVPNFLGDLVVDPATAADPRLAALPTAPFMLFVGALARAKGVDTLLSAYARAGAVRPMPPLVLIGYATGDYMLTPEQLPPGVTVIKDLPNELVMVAWQRSLFGIVPSIWQEPCPTVAMEAMACGRALIGSRVGGLPDLIDDRRTGLLVPPGAVGALAQAMAILVNDPDLCARFGEAGRKRVATFRASTVVERIETIYTQLLGQMPAEQAELVQEAEIRT